MDKIINSLNELREINSAYSLSNEDIDKALIETENAKVCTPIIGKFSSGKSALVNTLLGYSRKILKEDITPETAVPCEITYSPIEDKIQVIKNDGTYKEVDVFEFRKLEVDANTVRCNRLNLQNSFLKEIPDVMLVDMPGFESGFEVHNKAIDNYLPFSLAYIVAFPADDMIVRSSVGNILKELCLHDMPICIAITKYDKCNDEFEETFSALKENLRKFIGNKDVTYCRTSSYNGDAEELESFLREIQSNSQEILANKFRNKVLSIAAVTENYLKTTLKSNEMSESELDEEEEKINKKLDSLNNSFKKEKENFDMQISECVEEVKSDVLIALEEEESTLVVKVLNNQNINEDINNIVRTAVTRSVKKKVLPKIEKYMKKVSNCINGDSIGNVQIPFHFNTEEIGKGMVSTTVATVAAIIMTGPIIGAIIGGIIAFINKGQKEKKREEAKRQIRMKLNSEVYPQVIKEIGNGFEMAVTKQFNLINTSIEDEIKSQRATLEKAMVDARQKKNDKQEKKENLIVNIKRDLEKIEIIKNEI